jgi:hypothetical protein
MHSASDRSHAYRVGRKNPRNIYRVNPDSADHGDDEHVACAFDPSFGPVIAAALNATATFRFKTKEK